MTYPTIAITGNISIRKFGDSSYIFWTNNQPVVEVNFQEFATFVNWVGPVQCSDGTLIRYIDQYEVRAARAELDRLALEAAGRQG